ncbi:MAG: beta-hydroxyacyl-ACP dehydratase [Planctomycetes bacterium]|nr:beta-hydroxyacyl-ACP dehydratase [Planctomycetota bacterium]
MRWFLIDKVTALAPGERIRGVKCVTLGDDVLHDHFPDHPILPGALLLEAGAQLAGYLVEATFHREGQPVRRALLAQVRDARFYEPVGPGDKVELEATLVSSLDGAARARFEAAVDGKRVARGELTFVLKEVASPRVHEQRRRLYALWTRDLDPPPVNP